MRIHDIIDAALSGGLCPLPEVSGLVDGAGFRAWRATIAEALQETDVVCELGSIPAPALVREGETACGREDWTPSWDTAFVESQADGSRIGAFAAVLGRRVSILGFVGRRKSWTALPVHFEFDLMASAVGGTTGCLAAWMPAGCEEIARRAAAPWYPGLHAAVMALMAHSASARLAAAVEMRPSERLNSARRRRGRTEMRPYLILEVAA